VYVEALAANAFWCILSSKIALGGNIFCYFSRKNSCIGKKSRNGVQTFKKVAGRSDTI